MRCVTAVPASELLHLIPDTTRSVCGRDCSQMLEIPIDRWHDPRWATRCPACERLTPVGKVVANAVNSTSGGEKRMAVRRRSRFACADLGRSCLMEGTHATLHRWTGGRWVTTVVQEGVR